MQLLIILLTLLTATTPTLCDQEFTRAYKLATEWVYPNNTYIGEILAREEHNCNSWLPAYWNPGKVAVRPLYDDGLPLYDIFEEEWEQLVGFEFRSWNQIVKTCKLITKTTWHCWDDERELWQGYSIALTEQEKFIYAIMQL